MRYRKLDENNDYSFGNGNFDFLIDSPECVAQAVQTRLLLLTGEWFLDTSDGTPYAESILGKSNQITRDAAIRARILETPNVTSIVEYFSEVSAARELSVTARINTAFGQTTITATL